LPENNQLSGPVSAITLRPVNEMDLPLLRELYASTRAEEMALVPWSAEQQRAFIDMQFQAQQSHYQQFFPNATQDVVLQSDRAVGRLYVERSEKEIKIIDVTVLPRERNQGIGSYLLRAILGEAAESKKVVGIYVESFNSSLHLFKRLGFVETEQSGVHIYLQWFPPGVGNQQLRGDDEGAPP